MAREDVKAVIRAGKPAAARPMKRSTFDQSKEAVAARKREKALAANGAAVPVPGVVKPSAVPFSDDHLADVLAGSATDFRWSPGLGWMHFNGVVWSRDDKLARFNLARDIVRVLADLAPEKEKKAITSARTVSAALSLAMSDPRVVVGSDVWDADPFALNTPSGIIDLRTGRLRERGREYVTQVTGVAPDFDAQANRFDRFLLEVFEDDRDLVEFVVRALGYCLTGDRREQVFFFAHGFGGNGKNTLFDLVLRVFGSYAKKIGTSVLMTSKLDRHPTEVAQLRGVRLAISSEPEAGMHFNEPLLKELTGDEVMSARFMRQDFFEFRQTQKHIIVGNDRPRLHGDDPAMARRLVMLPFTAEFKDGVNRDRQMPEKLTAEAPAILARLIRGAVAWQRDGLGIPERARAASGDYLSDNDDIAMWMAECCRRIGEERATPLYQSFARWKRERGEQPQSQTAWGERLGKQRGILRRKSDGRSVYAGLALVEAERQRMALIEGWKR